MIFALLLTWQLFEDASLQLVQVFLPTLCLLLSQGVYCGSELIALPPAQTSLAVIRCGIFVVVLADVYGFVFPSLIIKRGRGIYWASFCSSCLCLCVCVICWFYFYDIPRLHIQLKKGMLPPLQSSSHLFFN